VVFRTVNRAAVRTQWWRRTNTSSSLLLLLLYLTLQCSPFCYCCSTVARPAHAQAACVLRIFLATDTKAAPDLTAAIFTIVSAGAALEGARLLAHAGLDKTPSLSSVFPMFVPSLSWQNQNVFCAILFNVTTMIYINSIGSKRFPHRFQCLHQIVRALPRRKPSAARKRYIF
jgi:hypothetical protein